MCIVKAIFIKGHVEPVSAAEVAAKVVGLLDIMKERHVSHEYIDERINYFEQHGDIQFADSNIVPIAKTHKKSSITYFLNKMGQHLFDACAITLLAIKTICEQNMVVDSQKVVQKLHVVISKLYEEGKVSKLHTSFKETIEDVLARFVSIGLIELKQNGDDFFIKGASDSETKIKQVDSLFGNKPINSASRIIKAINELKASPKL